MIGRFFVLKQEGRGYYVGRVYGVHTYSKHLQQARVYISWTHAINNMGPWEHVVMVERSYSGQLRLARR